MRSVSTVRVGGRQLPVWSVIVLLVVLSRVVLSVVGMVSDSLLVDRRDEFTLGGLVVITEARDALSPFYALNQWYSWDAFHYENLSRSWLEVERPIAPHIVTEEGGRAWNEFSWPPVYPLVIAGLSAVFPGDAGLLMVLFGVVLFLGLLRVIAAISDEDGDSDSTTALALLTVVVAPVSFILSIPMTEPLFALAGALSLLAIRRGQWVRAGLWSVLMTWVKMSGVYMIAPLALAALLVSWPVWQSGSPERSWRRIVMPWTAPFVCGVGYLGYLGFAWFMTGTPRAPLLTQRYGWGNEVGNPLWNLIEGFGFWQYRFVVALSLWAAWLAWRRYINPVDLLFSLVMCLSTLPVDIVAAAPRYAAVGFPVWIGTARWVRAGRRRWAVLPALAVLQLWLYVLWSNHWMAEIV